jgi:hypothetical protein
MSARLIALTGILLLASLSSAHAAPIQAVAYIETGRVIVGGLTGEIYISLRGPDELLDRPNAANIPGATKDNFVPGEVTYLNLGGFNGSADMGHIVELRHSGLDYSNLRFAYQTGFTSPIVELTPVFPGFNFTPPPGVEGFWITGIPEPASLGLLGSGLLSLALLRRRSSRGLALPFSA